MRSTKILLDATDRASGTKIVVHEVESFNANYLVEHFDGEGNLLHNQPHKKLSDVLQAVLEYGREQGEIAYADMELA